MPVPRESAWKNARATSARRGKRPFAAKNATSCDPCPAKGVQCADGLAQIDPGHWYPPDAAFGAATNLYDCLHPTEACVADGPTVACTQGYGGVLCGNCTDGYTRNGRRCVPCPATERSAGMVVAGAIVVYGVLLYNALHADGQESVASALWRIFISYYTVSSTMGEFFIRGTQMFQDFTETMTSWANALSFGFVPVVCTKTLVFVVLLGPGALPAGRKEGPCRRPGHSGDETKGAHPPARSRRGLREEKQTPPPPPQTPPPQKAPQAFSSASVEPVAPFPSSTGKHASIRGVSSTTTTRDGPGQVPAKRAPHPDGAGLQMASTTARPEWDGATERRRCGMILFFERERASRR